MGRRCWFEERLATAWDEKDTCYRKLANVARIRCAVVQQLLQRLIGCIIRVLKKHPFPRQFIGSTPSSQFYIPFPFSPSYPPFDPCTHDTACPCIRPCDLSTRLWLLLASFCVPMTDPASTFAVLRPSGSTGPRGPAWIQVMPSVLPPEVPAHRGDSLYA